jgi:hypothetical protein
MKFELRHTLAALVVLCVAWHVWQGRHTPATAPAPGDSVKAREPQTIAPDRADVEATDRERNALALMEAEKQKRDLAASKSLDARAGLLAACHDSWL